MPRGKLRPGTDECYYLSRLVEASEVREQRYQKSLETLRKLLPMMGLSKSKEAIIILYLEAMKDG